MLDHLDDRRGVEAREPRVAIHQRAVNQLDALALLGRHAIEMQPVHRHLEHAIRHVHAENARELPVVEQHPQ